LFRKFKGESLILVIVLFFLIISELVLIDQNFNLKKKISAYQHLEQLLSQAQNNIEHFYSVESLEGLQIPFISSELLMTSQLGNLERDEFDYILLFFFSPDECSSCLTSRISALNKFHIFCPAKRCRVIGITDTLHQGDLNTISRSLRIRFPLIHVPNLKNQLQNYGITSTPLAILGDLRVKKVIYADFNSPFYASDNEKFHKKLHQFFDLSDKQ